MKEVTFKILRFDPDKDKRPYFQKFAVPIKGKDFTVLEGLFYIQERIDGSLAFRASCRSSVCGSCAMHINGAYRLACNTLVGRLKSNTVTISPLAHLPVIKDLAVDMQGFWEKYELIKPYLMSAAPTEKENIQTPAERAKINVLVDCILCGCCYSSCPVTMGDKNYLGPHALLWIHRFESDTRDKAKEERLAIADNVYGVWRCHTALNCQKACPKDLDPAASIMHLRRMLMAKKFFGV